MARTVWAGIILAWASSGAQSTGVLTNVGDIPVEIPAGYTITGFYKTSRFSNLSAINTADLQSPLRAILIYHSFGENSLSVGLPKNYRFMFCAVSGEGFLLRHYVDPQRDGRSLVLVSTDDMVVGYQGHGPALHIEAMRTVPDGAWSADLMRHESLEQCLNKVEHRRSDRADTGIDPGS